MIFSFFEKAGAHLQYVCNNCANFQIDCLKTVGGVDCTILEVTDRRAGVKHNVPPPRDGHKMTMRFCRAPVGI